MEQRSPAHRSLQLTKQGRQQKGNELAMIAVDTRVRGVRDPLLDDMKDLTAGPVILNDQDERRSREERISREERRSREARRWSLDLRPESREREWYGEGGDRAQPRNCDYQYYDHRQNYPDRRTDRSDVRERQERRRREIHSYDSEYNSERGDREYLHHQY